jgi:multiple sugar transport system ATP-binding protein
MAEVVLKGLSKVFPNGVQAVRDLNLRMEAGELVVLIGPSGSGKTTTLRLVAGLEEPTAGEIRIDGRLVTRLPPRSRGVAMVFQRATVYPHLTVRGNLAFSLKLGRKRNWLRELIEPLTGSQTDEPEPPASVQAAKVEETARLLGLEKVLDRLPAQLSGGQQQRVALGRAIVRRPGLFLLDEPLSQVDAQLRSGLRYELHLLQRRLRATMIYVTHDQAEALLLADRVVVLKDGNVEQADSPRAVYETPRNRFVAGFFGWPPMNFVDGQLIGQGDKLIFKSPPLEWAFPPSLDAQWLAHSGRPVTLGIRPEDVLLEDAVPGSTNGFAVDLVETLGTESLVTVARGSRRLTARSGSWQVGAGGRDIQVGLRMENARLFDSVTGVALMAGRPAG